MDVKERFNVLKERKEKIIKAKLAYEVRLDALKKQMSEALNELYTKYNVKSLEEAKQKYNKTEQELIRDLESMEEQLKLFESSVKDIEV